MRKRAARRSLTARRRRASSSRPMQRVPAEVPRPEADLLPLLRGLRAGRPPRRPPAHLHAEQVGHRGHDVDRADEAVVDCAASLARRLDEEGHRGDLLDVGLAHLAPAADAHVERVAVVGRHHQQRAPQQPGAPQAPEQPAELPVHEAHLEQVPHVVVLGQARVVEAHPAVQASDRVLPGRPVAVAGGQVDPGLVREQRVVEVEGRALSPAHGSDPAVQALGPTAAGQPVEDARAPGPGAGADPRRTHGAGGLHLV